MKNLLSIVLMFLITVGMPVFSQTRELENEVMLNRYKARELSQLEYKDLVFAWRDLTDSIGYPDVPYDSVSKKVEYEFRNSLKGISRETIINRVSEWAAVTFGSLDGLLTHQGNTSRFICNGSVEVFFPDLVLVYKNAWRGYVETELQNSSICYFTMVFTIKEGDMRSQVLNISYQYTDFLTDRSISRTLNSCFPISNNEEDEWKAVITLVNETKQSLEIMIALLVDYIKDYENDYSW